MDPATTAVAVLGLMLHAGPPPGRTLYSEAPSTPEARPVVLVEGSYRELGENEPEPNQCSQPGNVACRRPRFDDELGQWVRVETFEEGLARYWLIANVLADVAAGDLGLLRFLVTIIRHESGLWRSVHAGWNHRPYRRTTKYEDNGKSWCLTQIMIGKSGKGPVPIKGHEHHQAVDLVGVDVDSTRRCLEATATRVRGDMRRCRGKGAACVFVSYGGGTVTAAHPFVQARLATRQKLASSEASSSVSPEMRRLLGLPAEVTP